jgi:hypothetical protein
MVTNAPVSIGTYPAVSGTLPNYVKRETRGCCDGAGDSSLRLLLLVFRVLVSVFVMSLSTVSS